MNEKGKKERFEKMKTIRDEVVGLKDSPLYKYRIEQGNNAVIGEGSHFAEVIFVGEAPGRNEAATGRPFCGAAGKVLDELLKSIGMPRSEVYITNIVKDRPPENRDPLQEEIDLYGPFLDRQIDVIKPKIIATLGRHSMAYIFNRFGLGGSLDSISKIHGKIFEISGLFGEIKIVPLFHPAVVVYDASKKDQLKEDFKIIKELLNK
jgi:uracil-DNA glycosylase